MAREIHRAFRDLAEYAEVVALDPQKAERIRQKQQEAAQFLATEDLSDVIPRAEIIVARKEESKQNRARYHDHLAAVAKEALRVSGDSFVHGTQMSVVRSLRERIREGDQMIIANYKDSALARHVVAGYEVLWLVGSGLAGNTLARMPLFELVASRDFTNRFGYQWWLDTMEYASEVLPNDTTTFDLTFLLLSYSKSVGPDSTKFITVEDRMAEIRKARGRLAA